MQHSRHNNTGTISLVIIAIMAALLIAFYEHSYASLYVPYNTAHVNTLLYCPYGYICGVPSYGCAMLGAIYNCPLMPANTMGNATVAVGLEHELKNSASEGFNLNSTLFRANMPSDCSLQLISQCDNNVPSQFICVNSVYSAQVRSQYAALYNGKSHICPMYVAFGNVSCGLEQGYCVVTDSAHAP